MVKLIQPIYDYDNKCFTCYLKMLFGFSVHLNLLAHLRQRRIRVIAITIVVGLNF